MKIFTLLLCCVFSFSLAAQNIKYEKESRIRTNEVPESALDFVAQLGFDSKIKWYREQNLQQTSIEAKTKYKSQRYSIEFSESGQIEDIEIIINEEEIPASTLEAIEAYLDQSYDRHKFCKAQIQYSGNRDQLLAKMKNVEPLPSSQVKYELVIKTKKDREKRIMEFLFDSDGKLERSSEVIFRNTDNLDF